PELRSEIPLQERVDLVPGVPDDEVAVHLGRDEPLPTQHARHRLGALALAVDESSVEVEEDGLYWTHGDPIACSPCPVDGRPTPHARVARPAGVVERYTQET